MTNEPTTRAAVEGELCTCGQQAQVVYETRSFGEVPSCRTDYLTDHGAGAQKHEGFGRDEVPPPAWLNIEAVFPASEHFSARVSEMVSLGERVLEDLHRFISLAAPLRHEVTERAWLHGMDDRLECPDDLPPILKRSIGADQLEDMLMAMVGIVEEATDGSPNDGYYLECLGRFCLEPIRASNGSGRAGKLVSEEAGQ